MKTFPQLQLIRAVRPRGRVLAALATLCAAMLSAPRTHAAAGDAVWTNRYEGLANSDDGAGARAIVVDGSGNVFVRGIRMSAKTGMIL